MRLSNRVLLLFCPLWTLLVVVGCTSKGPTRLCEGFESYETVQEVRNKISQSGQAERWTEDSRGTGRSDSPPLMIMSGPFKSLGIDGQMRLTFFSGRLMTTEFLTRSGQEYLAALRKSGAELPAKAASEITIYRRTRFRYDWFDGTLWFSWEDSKLAGEIIEWKKSHD